LRGHSNIFPVVREFAWARLLLAYAIWDDESS
jgi:hypothetical protein